MDWSSARRIAAEARIDYAAKKTMIMLAVDVLLSLAEVRPVAAVVGRMLHEP